MSKVDDRWCWRYPKAEQRIAMEAGALPVSHRALTVSTPLNSGPARAFQPPLCPSSAKPRHLSLGERDKQPQSSFCGRFADLPAGVQPIFSLTFEKAPFGASPGQINAKRHGTTGPSFTQYVANASCKTQKHHDILDCDAIALHGLQHDMTPPQNAMARMGRPPGRNQLRSDVLFLPTSPSRSPHGILSLSSHDLSGG